MFEFSFNMAPCQADSARGKAANYRSAAIVTLRQISMDYITCAGSDYRKKRSCPFQINGR